MQAVTSQDDIYMNPLTNFPTKSDESVVVICPVGNYNEATELGRYANLSVACNIISALKLPEYRVFSLVTGDEIQIH